jgi:hypothetical protein
VVRLSNGGILRGTVTEYLPGSHVVIVTAAGESKRFAAAEIASVTTGDAPPAAPAAPVLPVEPQAAPASVAAPVAPVAAPPPVTTPGLQTRAVVHAGDARFRFESHEPGLTLHLRTGTAISSRGVAATGYEPICAAPCEASLPAGTHEFGISLGGGLPVGVSDPLRLNGGETLDGFMGSRKKLRMAVLAAGGLIAVTGLVLILKNPKSFNEDSTTETRRNAGFGVAFGGIFFGVGGLVLIRDKPVLRVRPAAAR